MKTSSSTPVQSNGRLKKRWFAYFGLNALGLSIFLHILFGVVATFLIVEHFQKKHINFQATEPPSQHTEIEHKVQLSKRNNVESAPPDLKRIVTTDVSAITLPDPPEVPTTDEASPTPMAGVDGVMGMGLGTGSGDGNVASGGEISLFGAPDGSGMQAVFYDLKQTSDRKPTNIDDRTYYGTIRSYVSTGWDESLFTPYYKSKTPIYANSLSITTKPSGDGPRAFGLDKEVRPAYWIVHYHAKITPPVAGEYRFAGFGDNVLVVRVNNENVLEAGFPFLTDKSNLHQLFPFAFPGYIRASSFGDPHLRYGKTFRIEPAETADVDIILGDSGGFCCFFLLIQNMDNTYEAAPDGTPMLPIFQVGSRLPPTFSAQEEHPPISGKTEPWEIAN